LCYRPNGRRFYTDAPLRRDFLREFRRCTARATTLAEFEAVRLKPDPQKTRIHPLRGLRFAIHNSFASSTARPLSSARRRNFFSACEAKFIRLPLDNGVAAALAKKIKNIQTHRDIHRSGGQLLDKTGLTSCVCGGSLHVD
jgi:hypothetical protein